MNQRAAAQVGGGGQHGIVRKVVVADIGIARRRKALQHLAPFCHPRDELIDELCIVPLQRDVENCGHRKARLLARDQRSIALDDTGLLQRTHPAPAGRGGHPDLIRKLLVGGAAVLLEMDENPRVLVFDHGYRQNGLFHSLVRDIGQFYHNEPTNRKYW